MEEYTPLTKETYGVSSCYIFPNRILLQGCIMVQSFSLLFAIKYIIMMFVQRIWFWIIHTVYVSFRAVKYE